MTPQQLRNSILQMAIEGKLTRQLPEDGNAADLLKKIKAEKARLIKEKKIKKEKPLPEIGDDEVPFEIPDNWVWVRLGSILTVARGGSPRPIKDYLTSDDNGINWIKIGDTDKGEKYINSTAEKIKPEGLKKSRYVQKGDFLLSNSMSYGRPYILNIDGCIHDGWLVLRQYKQTIYNDYLYYLLSSRFVYEQFSKVVAGAVVNNLNSEKVAITVVPIPPVNEQKRIVARLEEILPLVDAYEKAYNELQELNKKFPVNLKNSLLQMAIEGKLVEQRPEDGNAADLLKQIKAEKAKLIKEKKIKKEKPLPEIRDDEIPFEIPDNWCWVRWGDIAHRIQYGYNAPAKDDGIYRMVRISDIQNGNIIWGTVPYCDISPEEANEYYIQKNDILFARTGGTVGKSFLVKAVPYEAVYAGYLIRTQYSEKLIPEYLKFFMESYLYWEQLRQGTIATAQPNCNGKTLGRMVMPLPPVNVQKRIVAKLEQLLPLCDELMKHG